MADLEYIAFPCTDDSVYVRQALDKLGFSDFSDLSLADMQMTLALALHLKRTEGNREVYES